MYSFPCQRFNIPFWPLLIITHHFFSSLSIKALSVDYDFIFSSFETEKFGGHTDFDRRTDRLTWILSTQISIDSIDIPKLS